MRVVQRAGSSRLVRKEVKVSQGFADVMGQRIGMGATMEISPIPGIRALLAAKPSKKDPQLLAVFDIESALGPQQDTFSQNEKEMTGGQDGESADQEAPAESSPDFADGDSGTVNLFA
jgi:hypothetical protein